VGGRSFGGVRFAVVSVDMAYTMLYTMVSKQITRSRKEHKMLTTASNLKKAAKQIGIDSKEIFARTEARVLKLDNGKTAREYMGASLYFRNYYNVDEAISIARQIAQITEIRVHAYLTYNSKRQVSISINTGNGTGIEIVDPYNTDTKYGFAHVEKLPL
jgi:hypothetical protein